MREQEKQQRRRKRRKREVNERQHREKKKRKGKFCQVLGETSPPLILLTATRVRGRRRFVPHGTTTDEPGLIKVSHHLRHVQLIRLTRLKETIRLTLQTRTS